MKLTVEQFLCCVILLSKRLWRRELNSSLEITQKKLAEVKRSNKNIHLHMDYSGLVGEIKEPLLTKDGAISLDEFIRLRTNFILYRNSYLWENALRWGNKEMTFSDTNLFNSSDLIKGNPMFTTLIETRPRYFTPLFEETIEAPSGHNIGFVGLINTQSAYKAAGSGDNCSGSIFHILVCPTVRIYNAVCLDGDDHKALLKAMREKTDTYIRRNLDSDDRLTGILNRAKIEQEMKAKDDAARFNAILDTQYSTWKALEEPLELGFFFHVHRQLEAESESGLTATGDHGIGHLHMHCFPLNRGLRTSFVHDHKCCSVDVVLQGISEVPGPCTR